MPRWFKLLDNDLIKLFRPIIKDGLSAQGVIVEVRQSYQPTKQGVKDSSVYFFSVSDNNLGFVKRDSVWNGTIMTYTETQIIESTYQISVLLKQNPNVISYTAKDILQKIASLLQSSLVIATLKNAGVSVMRITQIRNPYFLDDKDQYEASPSFDVIFQHEHKQDSTVDFFQSVEYNNIKRI